MDLIETGQGVNDFLVVFPGVSRQQIVSFLDLSKKLTLEQ